MGFRRKNLQFFNLTIYVNEIFQAFIEENKVDAIYTDFSRAFDSVNHQLLVKKLELIGINSKTVKLAENYLQDRMLIVMIGQAKAVPFFAIAGVPQGSYFGPLLFEILLMIFLRSFYFHPVYFVQMT